MIHESQAPPFPGYVNEYFSIESEVTLTYYQQSNTLREFFVHVKKDYQGEFMAYKNDFIENYYTYIRSAKMICFHITFMLLSIFGFIVSVTVFASAYGRS